MHMLGLPARMNLSRLLEIRRYTYTHTSTNQGTCKSHSNDTDQVHTDFLAGTMLAHEHQKCHRRAILGRWYDTRMHNDPPMQLDSRSSRQESHRASILRTHQHHRSKLGVHCNPLCKYILLDSSRRGKGRLDVRLYPPIQQVPAKLVCLLAQSELG